MILVTFKTLCPHCNRANNWELHTGNDVEGHELNTCSMCGKLYVVVWKMTAHGIVHPVGDALASVPCTVELDYDLPDGSEEMDEDEDEEIEA